MAGAALGGAANGVNISAANPAGGGISLASFDAGPLDRASTLGGGGMAGAALGGATSGVSSPAAGLPGGDNSFAGYDAGPRDRAGALGGGLANGGNGGAALGLANGGVDIFAASLPDATLKREPSEMQPPAADDTSSVVLAADVAVPGLTPQTLSLKGRSYHRALMILRDDGILEFRRAADATVSATVRGSGPQLVYTVSLPAPINPFSPEASCTCPDHVQRGGLCKHAVAVLLALVPGADYAAAGNGLARRAAVKSEGPLTLKREPADVAHGTGTLKRELPAGPALTPPRRGSPRRSSPAAQHAEASCAGTASVKQETAEEVALAAMLCAPPVPVQREPAWAAAATPPEPTASRNLACGMLQREDPWGGPGDAATSAMFAGHAASEAAMRPAELSLTPERAAAAAAAWASQDATGRKRRRLPTTFTQGVAMPAADSSATAGRSRQGGAGGRRGRRAGGLEMEETTVSGNPLAQGPRAAGAGGWPGIGDAAKPVPAGVGAAQEDLFSWGEPVRPPESRRRVINGNASGFSRDAAGALAPQMAASAAGLPSSGFSQQLDTLMFADDDGGLETVPGGRGIGTAGDFETVVGGRGTGTPGVGAAPSASSSFPPPTAVAARADLAPPNAASSASGASSSFSPSTAVAANTTFMPPSQARSVSASAAVPASAVASMAPPVGMDFPSPGDASGARRDVPAEGQRGRGVAPDAPAQLPPRGPASSSSASAGGGVAAAPAAAAVASYATAPAEATSVGLKPQMGSPRPTPAFPRERPASVSFFDRLMELD